MSIKSPDFMYLVFCQFGLPIGFSIITSTMLFLVMLVAFGSIPSQIIKMVVGWFAVIMTALHTVRAWTYEHLQNQPMYIKSVGKSVSIQANHMVLAAIKNMFEDSLGRRFDLGFTTSRIKRSYIAPIIHFITRKPRNRFPNFGGFVKMFISHCEYLLLRYELWLEPYRCENSGAACFLY